MFRIIFTTFTRRRADWWMRSLSVTATAWEGTIVFRWRRHVSTLPTRSLPHEALGMAWTVEMIMTNVEDTVRLNSLKNINIGSHRDL